MSVYLMSDLHLDAKKPSLTHIFFQFLRTIPKTSQLYLLGDIFEYWIGDDDDAPLVSRTTAALRQASDAGLSIYLMHGNRDFLIGQTFATRAGLTLLEDPHTATLGGIPTLLTHGDRYCTSDGRYVKFRAQVRDPQWQKALLAQPIEDRRALALKLRKESEANQNMQVAAGEELSDVVQSDITAELMTVHVLRLIHGHTHRPDNHEIHLPDGRNVERIVLADWRTNGEALLIKDDGTAERQVLAP